MKKRRDLTQGSILKNLIILAIPIMTTSFMQMAYNLSDMLWIGKIGYSAVSAVGTAGFYMWLSMSMVRLSQTGAEIGVSQSLGSKKERQARDFARNALQLSIFCAVLYAIILLLFKQSFIGFFNIPTPIVNQWAEGYLSIVALGMPFSFANLVFSSVYNGSGNSKVPFYFNFIGLGLNIILDPILIFGLLGLPQMGVLGAGIATVCSQIIVTICFVLHVSSQYSPFSAFHFFKRPSVDKILLILKYGLPMALQSASFTFFAMLIARHLSNFGDIPIAVQKVGSQVEAISWMTASGFSSALSAFVGQNFGAKRYDRIEKGYWEAMKMMLLWGSFSTIMLMFFASDIFKLFISEPHVLPYGTTYLQILGISQLFMCIEISTNGAFNGLGKTVPPSVISIVFTGLRVPFSYILSAPYLLGLNGVWWSISMSSVFKGIFAFLLFIWVLKKNRLAYPKCYV